jgi:hypothetical protein
VTGARVGGIGGGLGIFVGSATAVRGGVLVGIAGAGGAFGSGTGSTRLGGGATCSTVRPPMLVVPVDFGPTVLPPSVIVMTAGGGFFANHSRGSRKAVATAAMCNATDHVTARLARRLSALGISDAGYISALMLIARAAGSGH